MNKIKLLLASGIANPPTFARKAATGAATLGLLAGAATAALPTEYDLSAAGTTLAGYVSTAAGIGVVVFIALRAASLIPMAFKKLLH